MPTEVDTGIDGAGPGVGVDDVVGIPVFDGHVERPPAPRAVAHDVVDDRAPADRHDLAATGSADSGSLQTAIEVAVEMATRSSDC